MVMILAGEGGLEPPSLLLGDYELGLTDSRISFDWVHHSPGSDDAFPTPFLLELIVFIVLFPFLSLAFVVFFVAAIRFAAVPALVFGFAFASPKPVLTLASPLTITSIFPSALTSRGAMPPIKLITKPSTTAVFAKLVET